MLVQRSRFSAWKQWATFQIYCVQFVPESTILQALWNRQCHNGHNGDDLADFVRITTKFWFIMAISWYNCANVNKNFVDIRPNSVRSARVCPLRHERSSECLLKLVTGAELETTNLKGSSMLWSLHCDRCTNAHDISYPYRLISWPDY